MLLSLSRSLVDLLLSSSPKRGKRSVFMGGSYRLRQLKTALSFIARPLLLAVVLTVVVRVLFSSGKKQHGGPKDAGLASSDLLLEQLREESAQKPLKPLKPLDGRPAETQRQPQRQQQREKAPPSPHAHHHQHAEQQTAPTKHLVVASSSKTSSQAEAWLSSVPTDWDVRQYIVDAPLSANLSVPSLKGNEAMVYLTYIIDHYDDLPDLVFFHHDHPRAWHQELDSLVEVSSLRPSWVLKRGYVSARCLPGCENIIAVDRDVARDPPDMSLFPHYSREVHLAALLGQFLSRDELVPTKIAAPCCAQFAASAKQIKRRSRRFWIDLRQWLEDVPLPSMVSGRLIEYTWHIWLGEQPELCPSYESCRCHVFGIGDCERLFAEE